MDDESPNLLLEIGAPLEPRRTPLRRTGGAGARTTPRRVGMSSVALHRRRRRAQPLEVAQEPPVEDPPPPAADAGAGKPRAMSRVSSRTQQTAGTAGGALSWEQLHTQRNNFESMDIDHPEANVFYDPQSHSAPHNIDGDGNGDDESHAADRDRSGDDPGQGPTALHPTAQGRPLPQTSPQAQAPPPRASPQAPSHPPVPLVAMAGVAPPVPVPGTQPSSIVFDEPSQVLPMIVCHGADDDNDDGGDDHNNNNNNKVAAAAAAAAAATAAPAAAPGLAGVGPVPRGSDHRDNDVQSRSEHSPELSANNNSISRGSSRNGSGNKRTEPPGEDRSPKKRREAPESESAHGSGLGGSCQDCRAHLYPLSDLPGMPTVHVQRVRTVIGRQTDDGRPGMADVMLRGSSVETTNMVSRRHALLFAVELAPGRGHFVIYDSDSINGVYVNDKRVTTKTALAEDDVITFGGPSTCAVGSDFMFLFKAGRTLAVGQTEASAVLTTTHNNNRGSRGSRSSRSSRSNSRSVAGSRP